MTIEEGSRGHGWHESLVGVNLRCFLRWLSSSSCRRSQIAGSEGPLPSIVLGRKSGQPGSAGVAVMTLGKKPHTADSVRHPGRCACAHRWSAVDSALSTSQSYLWADPGEQVQSAHFVTHINVDNRHRASVRPSIRQMQPKLFPSVRLDVGF